MNLGFSTMNYQDLILSSIPYFAQGRLKKENALLQRYYANFGDIRAFNGENWIEGDLQGYQMRVSCSGPLGVSFPTVTLLNVLIHETYIHQWDSYTRNRPCYMVPKRWTSQHTFAYVLCQMEIWIAEYEKWL